MRHDVAFEADGVTLRGWLFVPEGIRTPAPGLVMTHGFSGIREQDVHAERFAREGFVVLFYDHRNFGASDGLPRQEVDPWRQVIDTRHAISFMRTRPEVDPERIGLWGTSFSGGHALVVGAMDRRIRAVVAQAFSIDGYEALRRRLGDAQLEALRSRIDQDYERRFRGDQPEMITVSEPGSDSYEFLHQGEAAARYPNRVTLRSRDLHMSYVPGAFVSRVAPTPLLMIVADTDTVTPTDLQLLAYERAGLPKKLVVLRNCEHYGVYTTHLEETCRAAIDWFNQHLCGAA